MAALSISVVSFVGMLVKHFARMRLCVLTILHLQPVNMIWTSEPDLKVGAKEDGAECAQAEHFYFGHMAHRWCVVVVRLFLTDKERR